MGLFRIIMRTRRISAPYRMPARPIPREMRVAVVQPNRPQPPDKIVSGRCWVIDGDTIVIGNMHIRLAGIDAPELDHPWGQQSKWALVKLCKAQTITALIKPEMSYDRVVAECFLPDGRDLAAELVKAGLALDWPKFSGGKYRHLEPADARKKLWRATLRQRGITPPEVTSDKNAVRTQNKSLPYGMPRHAAPAATTRYSRLRQANYWLAAFGLAVLLIGCSLTEGESSRTPHAGPRTRATTLTSFEVTATVLNVRQAPTTQSSVVAQIGKGTTLIPKRQSGPWYEIELSDGSTGWVHGGFLTPASNSR